MTAQPFLINARVGQQRGFVTKLQIEFRLRGIPQINNQAYTVVFLLKYVCKNEHSKSIHHHIISFLVSRAG